MTEQPRHIIDLSSCETVEAAVEKAISDLDNQHVAMVAKFFADIDTASGGGEITDACMQAVNGATLEYFTKTRPNARRKLTAFITGMFQPQEEGAA